MTRLLLLAALVFVVLAFAHVLPVLAGVIVAVLCVVVALLAGAPRYPGGV